MRSFSKSCLNYCVSTFTFAESLNVSKIKISIVEENTQLRKWYESFSSYMEGGELTKGEQEALRKDWQDIVNQASEEWKMWQETMGWDTSSSTQQQQSSKGYSITASQESVDETNGRLTAMYEVGLQMLSSLQSIQSVTVSVKDQNSILLEIKNIALSSNGHLQDISGFQKKIYDILRVDIPEIKQKLNSSL